MSSSQEFLDDVLEGLSRTQKSLSPKWLYDDDGSLLFEEITRTPEYYPTRTEAKIFEVAFPALRDRLGSGTAIAEYGSGASVKTRRLIESLQPSVYAPIDIAADFLAEAALALAEEFPDVAVNPVVADFTAPVRLPDNFLAHPSRMGFFPGSTIGNLDPEEAVGFMRRARKSIGDGATFLLCADLIKPVDVLEAAYDDEGGVTANFNLNLLTRMNRELGTKIDEGSFTHEARFEPISERIEMHLVAKAPVTVSLASQDFNFAEGESLHTESSYKFTPEKIAQLSAASGWTIEETWTDDKNWFGVFLLRAC